MQTLPITTDDIHPLSGPEHTSLTNLLKGVEALMANAYPRVQWVSAEISAFKEIKGGHYALELVEHDAAGKLIARAQSFIWRGKAEKIIAKFKLATGSDLKPGIKVLLSTKPEFSPGYGLRLVAEDIDPRFTLGDIAAKLNQIRIALAKEGFFNKNRSLAEAADFCRVAVISPTAAAGLGDFKADADQLEALGLCRFDYLSCAFQGVDAAKAIANALTSVAKVGAEFDAVCLIRGGGSVTDLNWLNDLDLAREVCLCPFPVFTGIGHERDNTILDEIANRRFDTPSKIAAHIRQVIFTNAIAAASDFDEIKTHYFRQVSMADDNCNLLLAKIEGSIEQQLHIAENQIENYKSTLIPNALRLLSDIENKLEQGRGWLENKATDLLNKAEAQVVSLKQETLFHADRRIQDAERETDFFKRTLLENASNAINIAERDIGALVREILAVGPEATLRRGFALVRDATTGTPILSSSTAQSSVSLILEFRDGKVKATPEHD